LHIAAMYVDSMWIAGAPVERRGDGGRCDLAGSIPPCYREDMDHPSANSTGTDAIDEIARLLVEAAEEITRAA
jgi:hypothetical protein